MQIWQHCNGNAHKHSLRLQAWRVVEDQTRSSTRSLVDTTKEHAILENILEENKPKLPTYGDEAAFKGLHYLLFTPFRYPPLTSGSRFGGRFERNLFYASMELTTAITEKAFHRLKLLLASEGDIGNKAIAYTAFKVNFNIHSCIDLSKKPFNDYKAQISSPISYIHSQALGKDLRLNGVHACVSYSARCKNNGKNVNVFSPKAFGDNQELEKTFKSLSCYQTKQSVEFYFDQKFNSESMVFNAEDFFVEGKFPLL